MSDEQKAIASLHNLVESCTTALTVLSDRLQSEEDHITVTFSTLRTDFLSILSIIYATTTKVALSLKPSSPQHKASLVPLKDLNNNVAALVHSIRLMRPKEGATVIGEYESIALGVISAIKSLAQALLEGETPDATTQEYLLRTGEVHELIDNVRKPNGLSLDNRDAVQKLWQQVHDSLEDGYQEIQSICKPPTDEEEEGEEAFFDDGWDELGFSSDQKLSPEELDRAEKVQTMVKVVNLLHKRVIKDVFSSVSFQLDSSSLDKLATLSVRLSAGSDEVISSMYAPQQLLSIKSSLHNFWDTTKDIRMTILPPAPTLTDQLESLSISADDKIRKWFNACFNQIDKTAAKVIDTLHDEDEDDS
ncbi:hypothetical protein CPB84DRAFT_1776723 [Gymnopilus junonius]|uniref:Grap2 and cyclin-D-interacting-domain-containing protein n=1 Tax=Gymnopilus junonius TaxID=109634 RepID=A0A9P5NQK1_GYMJU|nr:hypothetical protein CPB84DRAFT_1776723 [Gymnopilus junonius]